AVAGVVVALVPEDPAELAQEARAQVALDRGGVARLEDGARGRGLARVEQVVCERERAPRPRRAVLRRGQVERKPRELRRGGRRTARRGVQRRLVELRGDDLVRAYGRECQVPRALLLIVGAAGERAMRQTPPGRRHRVVDRRGDKWVLERNATVRIDAHEALVLRGKEVVRRHDSGRRHSERSGEQEGLPRSARQARDTRTDELLHTGGDRQPAVVPASAANELPCDLE